MPFMETYGVVARGFALFWLVQETKIISNELWTKTLTVYEFFRTVFLNTGWGMLRI